MTCVNLGLCYAVRTQISLNKLRGSSYLLRAVAYFPQIKIIPSKQFNMHTDRSLVLPVFPLFCCRNLLSLIKTLLTSYLSKVSNLNMSKLQIRVKQYTSDINSSILNYACAYLCLYRKYLLDVYNPRKISKF